MKPKLGPSCFPFKIKSRFPISTQVQFFFLSAKNEALHLNCDNSNLGKSLSDKIQLSENLMG
jgi:hypothetical protein